MKKNSATQTLYRLIYCSLRVAPPEAGGPDCELEEIVATARRNNQTDGVTGALLFTGSGFAHVLEGARDALDRIFERIADDPRHTGVTVLSFTPTERRRFPEHAMALIGGLPAGMQDPVAGIRPDPEHDRPRVTTGGDILRLLETLVRASAEITA